MTYPIVVRQTPVREGELQLTVSTVKLQPRRYSTVVFDDSREQTAEGRKFGRFLVDHTTHPDDTREEAMGTHREALEAICTAARTEATS
jgi:hypothetical protein